MNFEKSCFLTDCRAWHWLSSGSQLTRVTREIRGQETVLTRCYIPYDKAFIIFMLILYFSARKYTRLPHQSNWLFGSSLTFIPFLAEFSQIVFIFKIHAQRLLCHKYGGISIAPTPRCILTPIQECILFQGLPQINRYPRREKLDFRCFVKWIAC